VEKWKLIAEAEGIVRADVPRESRLGGTLATHDLILRRAETPSPRASQSPELLIPLLSGTAGISSAFGV
jgi:hypothetical protein